MYAQIHGMQAFYNASLIYLFCVFSINLRLPFLCNFFGRHLKAEQYEPKFALMP